MDDGNGLNYMRARYYQPEIKRFLSLDALLGNVGEPQTLNRYGYVLGDPIGGVDPSGNITLDTRDRLSIPFANSHATLDIDATADLSLVNAGFQAQKDIKVYFLDYDTNHHGYVNGFSSNYSIYTDAVSGLELNGSVMNKEGYVAPSVEGAAGACVSANIDGGMELFGVKIDMDVSKNAGYCAGGAAKIHNDSKYVGYSVSGDIALMLGLGGKLDVRVNKKYWNEKGQQLYHSKSVYETAKWTLYGIKRDIRDAFK
jgi:RHS repeat-associated protein